jgi:hypothetical protein
VRTQLIQSATFGRSREPHHILMDASPGIKPDTGFSQFGQHIAVRAYPLEEGMHLGVRALTATQRADHRNRRP